MDIEEIKKLLAAPSVPAKKLESVAASLPALIAAATERHKVLQSDRRAKLLSAPDQELAVLDAEAAALLLRMERLQAFAEEVDTRLARSQQESAAAAVAVRQADVIRRRDEAVARFQKDYPAAAAMILSVLHDFAKVDAEIDAFQRLAADNGIDVDPVAGPEELARTRPALAPEIIEESIVWRWVFASNGNRIVGFDIDANPAIPLEKDGKIFPWVGDGRRTFQYRSSPSAYDAEVVRQKFKKVTTKTRHAFPAPLSLAETVALPGVFGGDVPIWNPLTFNSPAAVLEKLEKRAKPATVSQPERQTEVKWIPITEGAAADRSSTDAA